MDAPDEQKRAAILVCHAAAACVLAWVYDHDDHSGLLVARLFLPFVAFGLVVARVACYLDHVIAHGGSAYVPRQHAPGKDQQFALSEQLMWYGVLLIAGHVFVAALVVFEYTHAPGAPALYGTLALMVGCEVAETYLNHTKIAHDREARLRPPSPPCPV